MQYIHDVVTDGEKLHIIISAGMPFAAMAGMFTTSSVAIQTYFNGAEFITLTPQ